MYDKVTEIKVGLTMSTGALSIVVILSTLVWMAVCREVVKPTEKIQWGKTTIFMGIGSLLTAVLLISLFQTIPFLN